MITENPFDGREYDGRVFSSRHERNFFIGRLSPRQRVEWLRDHPERWQTREDFLRDLQARAGTDVEAEPPEARSATPLNEVRTSSVSDDSLPAPSEDKRLPDERCPRARTSLSERCHKSPPPQLLKRGAVARHPVARMPPPILGASETERNRRSPSQNDTDVAGWRRVSCWWRRCALGPSSPSPAAPNPRRRPIGTNKPSTSAASDRSIATHSAAHAAGAGRAPRRSISPARRCPRARTSLSERCHKSPPPQLLKRGAVARHPVARIAPPAPVIISASRARVGDKEGERENFSLILQCAGCRRRFWARARPSAIGGHHPRTTRMSLGGGECRVGGAAAHWDHHHRHRRRRILAAVRSAPTNHRRRPPATVPLPHTAPHTLLAQVAHPAGRSHLLVAVRGLALRSASDAIRAPHRSC
jgi:hypothetical protein